MEEKLDFLTYQQHLNEYLTEPDNSLDNKHDVLMLKHIFKFIYKNFAKISYADTSASRKHNFTIEMADVLPILHHSLRLEVQRENKMHIGAFLMLLLNLHDKDADGLQKCLQIMYQILKTLTPEDTQILEIGNEIFFKMIEMLSSNYSTPNNNANILLCLQLYSKKFNDIEVIWNGLWNAIKDSLSSNRITENSAHLQILLTCFDEFLQHIKGFKESTEFTRLIQHLLNSDQHDIRKSAYLILKKTHVFVEEQINSYLAMPQEKDDMQRKHNFWVVLINCFENLEENQSHLILPTLEQLRILNISNLIEQLWLDTLYRHTLRHNNKLVRRWILEYILENLTYFSMTNETQMEFMRALNDTSLYNFEGYMLPKNNVNRFLNCNKSKFLLSFSQIDWKAVPLHYWLSNLIKHWKIIHNTDASNEVIINLATKIRSLQNTTMRWENIKLFKQLFSNIIGQMDLWKYVQLIEALYNISDYYGDMYELCKKIENCQDCNLDGNRIFTQKFYKILTNLSDCSYYDGISRALVNKMSAKNWQPGLLRFIIVFESDISISKSFCKTHYGFEPFQVEKEMSIKQMNDYYIEKLRCTKEEESILKLHATSYYLRNLCTYEDLTEDVIEELLNFGSDRILMNVTYLLKERKPFVGDSVFEMLLKSLRSHSNSYRKDAIFRNLLTHCKRNETDDQARRYVEIIINMDWKISGSCIINLELQSLISDDLLIEKALIVNPKVGDSRIEEAYEGEIEDKVYRVSIFTTPQKRDFYSAALIFEKDENQKTEILKGLCEKIESINSRRPRYFANSKEHRLLNRIMSVILFIVPTINLDSQIFSQLWKFLMEHNNQPNIAIFYQLIIAEKVGWQDLFTKVSAQLKTKCTPSQEISMIAVLYRSYRKNHDLIISTQFGDLIDLLWPLRMGANHQTRLFAQLSIFQLINEFNAEVGIMPETFTRLSEAIRTTITDEQIQKFKEDIRFTSNMQIDTSTFDQVMQYTNAPYDEYNFEGFEKNGSSQNERDQCASDRTIEASYDIQRKLNPINDFMPQSNLYSYPEVEEQVLYVVASLVDKIPNLGGIARTCEVLGIRNLVMDSKANIAKADFKSLSMTAEKNLNIIEVKPSMLADFIINKKTEGFKIIGAEQTANSCSFVNFKYPKKSVLLLGHEKEGIPPNLLGFLDYAVEIPQFGMIRSLNVHVTGALFIWEYCKQHIVPTK